jgi:hypothetical protein
MGGPETCYEGITFGLLAIVRAKLRFQACRARKKINKRNHRQFSLQS